MSTPDFNLLVALDVLLDEVNVARAAVRLNLSPSAMSRALSRLRSTTGDPLLVRAGRELVPTPRALELRQRVGSLVLEAESILRPMAEPNLDSVTRCFTLQTSDGFFENFIPPLLDRIAEEAPGIQLRCIQKPDRDAGSLRDGTADIEIGVVRKSTGPELRAQALFRDRFIGVVRPDHPLAESEVTFDRYIGGRHVLVTRRGQDRGPIDETLAGLGTERKPGVVVSSFTTAVSLARTTDLIATVPERHTGMLRAGLFSFDLPLPPQELTVSLLWHPRLDADPVHRWLRTCIRGVCSSGAGKQRDRRVC
ncbi:LysR family transcriptional regulator [Pannonibacter sp.]|uniref:LysR family transcriptional regulator n=1 Tax=Pannonibacter sp. TaxID=1906786 RepID=UPI003F70A76F